MNKEKIRSTLIEIGVIHDGDSKREAYINIKTIIDEIYNSPIDKCVSNVCSIAPYTFLSPDDIMELRDLAEDMCIYVQYAKFSGLSNDSLIKIKAYFNLISVKLSHYHEVNKVAVIMRELSIMIHEYKDSFSQLDSAQIELLNGFTSNFERWVEMLFVKGGVEINFMDDSLEADKLMIEGMVNESLSLQSDDDLFFCKCQKMFDGQCENAYNIMQGKEYCLNDAIFISLIASLVVNGGVIFYIAMLKGAF